MKTKENVLYLTKAQAQARRLYLTDGQVSWIIRMSKQEPFPLSRHEPMKFNHIEPEQAQALMVTCYDKEAEKQAKAKELADTQWAIDINNLAKTLKIRKPKRKANKSAGRDYIGIKPRGHKYAGHTIKLDGRCQAIYTEMKQQGYLNPQETADILGCCRSSLTDQFKHGLNYLKRGKYYFYQRAEVEKYLQKRLKKKASGCVQNKIKKADF